MIFVLLQLFSILYGFNVDAPDFVKEYHQASTQQMASAYIETYSNRTNPSIQGYVISLKMKQSKYYFLPWNKFTNFKREKENLEKLISKNPNNVHLKYVRLVIQEKLPKILNYYSHIKEDKKFLEVFLAKEDSMNYLDFYIKKNTSL